MRCSMLPNRRRIIWLSVSSNQCYRGCFSNRPTFFNSRSRMLGRFLRFDSWPTSSPPGTGSLSESSIHRPYPIYPALNSEPVQFFLY